MAEGADIEVSGGNQLALAANRPEQGMNRRAQRSGGLK
jgi:hypothetical protein